MKYVLKLNMIKYDSYKHAYPIINTFFLFKKIEKKENKKIKTEMGLDFLILLHDYVDDTLVFRRSRREGICGSCAMNINGLNTLACIYKLDWTNIKSLDIFPLTHMVIVKDLVVSMDNFFEQYKYINPYLKQENAYINKLAYEILLNKPQYENLQSIESRNLLNNIYECILCACCTSSCPSYWWNNDMYYGPAILLQAYRWLIDTRDDYIEDRLFFPNDSYKLYRCHLISNRTEVCPKGLNPASTITSIQTLIKQTII